MWSDLVFEFSLVSLFKEKDTVYRTQLEGMEDEPSQWTRENKKEYPFLPDGQYRFKVWGKDYAGNISGPIEISFNIKPPPWRT
jgi:hypothetical protein